MTGELFINNKDAYLEWGVSLEDEGLSALMSFKPNKEPVTNRNVTANGSYVVCGTGLVEERTVSVPFHLVAADESDFLIKRANFRNYISFAGHLEIRTVNPTRTYDMYYLNCSQYTQFMSGLAKFVLSLYEPSGGGYEQPHDVPEVIPVPDPGHDVKIASIETCESIIDELI